MTARGVLGGIALLLLSSGACGASDDQGSAEELEGSQRFSATYEIRSDASRTARVELEGQVLGASSLEDADAGEADVFIRSAGTVKITNTSRGRAIERGALDHALSIKMPFDACTLSPNFAETVDGRGITGGILCSYDFLEIETPDLDPGQSAVFDFEDLGDGDAGVVSADATTVGESDADTWVAAATRAVVTAGVDERSSLAQSDLNPVCTYPGREGPVQRATFWTSNSDVDECSTESDSR